MLEHALAVAPGTGLRIMIGLAVACALYALWYVFFRLGK